ncbi:uncharacterized protein LOC106874253 [Octopus bimaculoides]|uniref:uncharacterized protein LOC106874253 n=1 Tax=Octopus bimaculoides TaxID=37653 RepID=UPI00071CBFFD|nr:uncharacterized protein LOC106874253 [Octopus bimaculoides]|eukprot:XP_014777395.1 PREDICTED: uncharacterized protein LOC106874253 [Octopus bimaculoides]
MDQISHRGVIKHPQKKALAPKDIHTNTLAKLEDDTPTLSTVQNWAAELGREERVSKMTQGLDIVQLAATSEKNIGPVYSMLMDDKRLTNQISTAISITRERFENILHNEIVMTKVPFRWMLRRLTPD